MVFATVLLVIFQIIEKIRGVIHMRTDILSNLQKRIMKEKKNYLENCKRSNKNEREVF